MNKMNCVYSGCTYKRKLINAKWNFRKKEKLYTKNCTVDNWILFLFLSGFRISLVGEIVVH